MTKWTVITDPPSKKYRCYKCGNLVASVIAFLHKEHGAPAAVEFIYICPHCHHPTYFTRYRQIPAPSIGKKVEGLPDLTEKLYEEARDCTGAGAYTAAVLACRKILMHIAVEKGAKEGKGFQEYVEYLSDKNYVPPDGKAWVDKIRQKGNEANHQIVLMSREDAEDLIFFLQMLLTFVYEFPSKIKSSDEG